MSDFSSLIVLTPYITSPSEIVSIASRAVPRGSFGFYWVLWWYVHKGLCIVQEDLVIDINPTEVLGMFSRFHFPGYLRKCSWWCL